MLIGIDGSRAVKFPRTGTEKYSFELIKAFTKLVTKHQFVIYLSKDPLVENNLAGNEKIFAFLVGQIMKATQGRANPQKVNEILRQKLTAGR